MGIWGKVATAFRGGVSEAGEAIVDHQALRILDQEIREADNELAKSKSALAGIIAKRKLVQRKVDSLQTSMAEYEGYAMKALDQGDETLATEVAQKIAGLEGQLGDENAMAKAYGESEAQLRKSVSTAEANLKRLKHQVDTVKATESVQRAQASVAARFSGADSSMRGALDSLERLKSKQAERSARFEAAAELAESTEDETLDSRLKAAGIVSSKASGDDVLARLRAKQAK